MKSLIFFIIGFALALAVLFLWNLQYFRQRRKKRKEELQEHPERKTSATKIIIFSILLLRCLKYCKFHKKSTANASANPMIKNIKLFMLLFCTSYGFSSGFVKAKSFVRIHSL